MSGLPPAGAKVRLAEAPTGEVVEHRNGRDGQPWAFVRWQGVAGSGWYPAGALVDVTPADPERCECGGSGILWGQTYGYAGLSVRELEVQACDVCKYRTDDEAAACAGARLLHASYRYAPPAGGWEPGDDDDPPPGDWVVELPHDLVALREADGDGDLIEHVTRLANEAVPS